MSEVDKIKKIYWPYIVLSYASLFSLGMLDNSRGPFFLDLTKSMGVNDTLAALFFVVPSAFAVWGSHSMPKILNRFHLVSAQRFSILGMCVSFFTFSLAPSLGWLLLSGIFYGVTFGMLTVGQHVCIQEGAPKKYWRRLFSGLHSMYGISSLLSPLIIAFLMERGVDWRDGFQVLSGLAAISVLLSFFLRPKKSVESEAKIKHQQLKITWPYFYMATAVSCYIISELVISTRYALYLRRAFDFSPHRASELLSLFFLMLLIGRLTFTLFPFERLANRTIIITSVFSTLIINLLGLMHSPYWLAFCGLTMAPMFGVYMDYLEEVFPEKSTEAIAATMAISSIYIVSMHYIVGAVTESFGIAKALFVGPIFLIVCIAMLLLQNKFIERT